MKIAVLLLLFILFVLPRKAFAGYIDPGTGSTLIQGIAAAIAKISRFFRKLFGGKK